jgi:hypothetical protein
VIVDTLFIGLYNFCFYFLFLANFLVLSGSSFATELKELSRWGLPGLAMCAGATSPIREFQDAVMIDTSGFPPLAEDPAETSSDNRRKDLARIKQDMPCN